MTIVLGLIEARIIGCLIEKEITTPEQYPLSLNSLTNACNQKSNRDPVMELDEATVQQALDGLVRKNLVGDQAGYGSRVTKYQHRFCNTEFGQLKFSPQELGVICELLLRGPQTPGELRSRANRLCVLNDVTEAEAALRKLSIREDGPYVVRLAREPGKRESRYAQLFCGEVIGVDENETPLDIAEVSAGLRGESLNHDLERRVAALEEEVRALKAFVASFQ